MNKKQFHKTKCKVYFTFRKINLTLYGLTLSLDFHKTQHNERVKTSYQKVEFPLWHFMGAYLHLLFDAPQNNVATSAARALFGPFTSGYLCLIHREILARSSQYG